MARGAQEFEAHFPGLLDDMVADGVPILENRPDASTSARRPRAGHRRIDSRTSSPPTCPAGRSWNGRFARTAAIENVDIVRAGIAEPTYDAASDESTGVLLDSDEAVPADLVVDATGRGTRLPCWLRPVGLRRPREETVDVGIAYASHQFHVPEGLLAEKVVVAGASRAQPLGIGMLFYEDGTWNVTTFGVGKVEPPQTVAQMLDLVDEIAARALLLRAAAGHPARRDGVPQVPDQSLAPLRQARALPRRHLPVRRRRRQLQSHLRAGHDHDGHPGRRTCVR